MTSVSLDQPLKVAQIGCGVVGTEVAKILLQQGNHLEQQVGRPLELAGIAVRDVNRARDAAIPTELFTADASTLVKQADLVVEVAGDSDYIHGLLLEAIDGGASVVTANKALLARTGDELFDAADKAGVSLFCEAAVAGAIPLLRPLRDSLSGDRIHRVLGIVNGTTNFILDHMNTTGASFDDALTLAQELGYAEADPTADIEGHDAAAKAALIARLAFNTSVHLDDVYCEGITGVTAIDMAYASRANRVIKMLAVCDRIDSADGSGPRVTVRVHPIQLPATHPLSSVREAFNAVFVEAEYAGQLMFYGPGAGGAPTASAVVGDLVTAARLAVSGSHVPLTSDIRPDASALAPFADSAVKAQVRLIVHDVPGVLAQAAQTFAAHGVSIESVQQRAAADTLNDLVDNSCDLVVTTHTTTEKNLGAAVAELTDNTEIFAVASVLRVLDE